MTELLALVRDVDEVAIAAAGGADIVECGAPAPVASLRAALEGRARLSLRRPGLDGAPDGLDHLRIDWPAAAPACMPAGTIGVVSDIHEATPAAIDAARGAGLAGLMIDTTPRGRILDLCPMTTLAAFAAACRAAGLLAAFGGLIEAPDVPRLLLLAPDILGIRGALRRNGRLDPSAMRVMRDLVPRAGEAAAAAVAARAAVDHVFVHDFVLPAYIGAYGRERGEPRRVRFNVDVEVQRLAHDVRDMRDVFSYDLVLDAIHLVTGRGHVALVETLAEDVARLVLAHPRVAGLSIRVEKLDMIEGTLGVLLHRRRADIAAGEGSPP